jgi:hypothetical protein
VNNDRLYSVPAALAGLFLVSIAAWYWHMNWGGYFITSYGLIPSFVWQTFLMALFIGIAMLILAGYMFLRPGNAKPRDALHAERQTTRSNFGE